MRGSAGDRQPAAFDAVDHATLIDSRSYRVQNLRRRLLLLGRPTYVSSQSCLSLRSCNAASFLA